MNGGFGLVLDGSDISASKAASMLAWDVNVSGQYLFVLKYLL